MKSSTSGFTIVELIIVIVVIGILAAITIVSYGRIQTRAYNTQVISGVSSYLKLIEVYQTFEGRYPPTSRENAGKRIAMTCLGTGYKDGYCGSITGTEVYEDSVFKTELDKVGNGGPVATSKLVPGWEVFVGAVYGLDTTDPDWADGHLYARTIQYALKGKDADCQLPGSYVYTFDGVTDVTACEIILEPIPTRAGFPD